MFRSLFLFLLFSTTSFAYGPWTQKCSIPATGRHLACSMVIGQRAYIGGGWDGTTTFYDFWEYDPATNAWTQRANSPALLWNVPCFGIDTAGYFCFPGNTWMFRPTANTWTNVNPAAPANTYAEERKWVINGKGYVCNTASIFEFDPLTAQWTSVYTLPSSGFSPDVAFAIGNKAYLMDNYYQKFYEYDPAAGTLIQKAPCPLNNTYGIGFGLNGKGYCGLGFTITQVGSIKDMAEYDPVTDSWRGITEFEGSDRRKATSFVMNNRGYIGCGSSGINLCDLWEFDPAKITDVNENASSQNIMVFPNPSKDGLFCILQTGENKMIAAGVYDVAGKLLSSIDLSFTDHIDLHDLPGGTYFISLLNDQHAVVAVKKVLVEK
jgi:N-acetylneuraminic acid mutarotase